MKKLYVSLMLLTVLGASSFNVYTYYRSRAGLGVGVGLGSFAAGALVGSAISRDRRGYPRCSRRYIRDLEREISDLRVMVRDLERENNDLKNNN